MRILLDECVHAGIKEAFPGHEVKTVTEIGLRSSKDGPLLISAQTSFDVFVTIDRKLEHQQNVKKLNLGVVVVRVRRNELADYRPLFESMRRAAENVRAGELIHVSRVG